MIDIDEAEVLEKELTDGLSYSREDTLRIREWLMEYSGREGLSAPEMREIIWRDSDWVFSQIFG